MNDVHKKLIERYRKNAIDWYDNRVKPSPETRKPVVAYAEEDVSKEIEMIKKIEEIIRTSTIEDSRKTIFIGSLKNSREQLERGEVPERLPNIVRNLSTNENFGNMVRNVCELTTNGGKSYAYLWGL